jgi:hypothetical protein
VQSEALGAGAAQEGVDDAEVVLFVGVPSGVGIESTEEELETVELPDTERGEELGLVDTLEACELTTTEVPNANEELVAEADVDELVKVGDCLLFTVT